MGILYIVFQKKFNLYNIVHYGAHIPILQVNSHLYCYRPYCYKKIFLKIQLFEKLEKIEYFKIYLQTYLKEKKIHEKN